MVPLAVRQESARKSLERDMDKIRLNWRDRRMMQSVQQIRALDTSDVNATASVDVRLTVNELFNRLGIPPRMSKGLVI